MLLATFIAASVYSATTAPKLGSLGFGASPAAVRHVLGKENGTDTPDDFTWLNFALGKTTLRVAFYKDRVSQFALLPDKPITTSQARAWALAFCPGLDRGREVMPEPDHKVVLGTFTMQGRPFETLVRFDMLGKEVTAVGGEIHWLD
jgi:hypothetical protein